MNPAYRQSLYTGLHLQPKVRNPQSMYVIYDQTPQRKVQPLKDRLHDEQATQQDVLAYGSRTQLDTGNLEQVLIMQNLHQTPLISAGPCPFFLDILIHRA